jgi:hypothetical protein
MGLRIVVARPPPYVCHDLKAPYSLLARFEHRARRRAALGTGERKLCRMQQTVRGVFAHDLPSSSGAQLGRVYIHGPLEYYDLYDPAVVHALVAMVSWEPLRKLAVACIGVQFVPIHPLERIAQRRVLNLDGLPRAAFGSIRKLLHRANIASERPRFQAPARLFSACSQA